MILDEKEGWRSDVLLTPHLGDGAGFSSLAS